MRILYVAHYRENSGWGEAARNYILALDKAGADVVCRPILFKNNAVLPDRIKELEAKSGGNFDYCIQNVLPHYMEWHGAFKKNVGQYVEDSIDMRYTSWYPKLKKMDALFGTLTTQNTHTGNPYYHIPHCFDMSVYKKTYKKLDIPRLDNKFVFYFIGEFNRRKNVSALLRAFHSTFSKTDDVALILKVNKPGVSAEKLGEEVNNLVTSVKKHLGKHSDLNKYQNEIVIPFDLPREDILRLHATANCFVTASYGEGWCIPAFEAAYMGNMVVAPDTEPYIQYAPNLDLLFEVSTQPMVGAEPIFPGFGTCREFWSVPNVMSVGDKMLDAANRKDTNTRVHIPDDSEFSLENVGRKMMEALND